MAVLGILFANITAFGHPFLAYTWPAALPDGGTAADSWVWLFQFVAVDGKFRGIFTVLFGAGLFLFMERVWAKGGSRWLQARRLGWLLAFGLAHFFLLFFGDILTAYAIWGLVALSMLKLEAKTQFWTGIILYILFGLILMLASSGQALPELMPQFCVQAAEMCDQLDIERGRMISDMAAQQSAYGAGSYADMLSYRATEQWSLLAKGAGFGFTETLPLILIGVAFYRWGVFDGRAPRAKLVRLGWAGVLVGSAITLGLGLWVMSRDFPFWTTSFVFFGASGLPRLPVVLGLVCLLGVYGPQLAKGALGQRFVAAGRMAFSNYIGTSALMLPVFGSWGLGLFGELSRLELLGIVLAVWALMLLWSKPWLEVFRYGPLEWLWRCLTYWTLVPMRLERAAD
ncbi:uncharacterized protein HME9302_00415 [Alteripontixanthobacter maritimus]|uniref:DUF418 domain-containing protein n=1 Tax=Alteripontixanthobacter maritimus TaxID=2161824 RepID=A0A369Q8H4_9SPHN|nr:DUF418 domain-containing protein [Alteripontixanthobacter maritimus]RDC59229.1 uncharacterized protein HME9302_00415 [Alteripontixanthobacter maritimus]